MPSRNEVEGRGRRRGLGKPDPVTHPECQRACLDMWGRKVSHEGRCWESVNLPGMYRYM